ncbi:hypothetical protein BCR34DRAFT_605762 [Clohesyomyces aquaticus]|uniref:Uncharacterized protein n=1 Tax=Clohesyomyces aquaticus TaxID=1231657 RepID=A0A1Y1YVB0_9PLEO|nr:hypothetical protein BCR34DRAFT_605762 [Clohesyomyces aquaticus]
MDSGDQVSKSLDLIKEQMWIISVDDSGYSSLRTKISDLLAQVAVHRALARTVRWLQEPNETSKSHEKPLRAFMKAYGNKDGPRWDSLRSLGCETLLFIAASWNSAEIEKMSKDEFMSLLNMAPQYLLKKDLPSKWMFRTDFQVAMAANAKYNGIVSLKRKYHEIENKDQEPQKRPRTEQEKTSMEGPTRTRSGQGIEMAFAVAPDVWDKIYESLSRERVASEQAGEPQTILLTIPAEDRVGTVMHSIPRRMAMRYSQEYNLTKIAI